MENQAWTWEHQALIRARPITGDQSLMARFNGIRLKILCRSRPARELKQAVREMRERMRSQKLKSDTGMFDLKQGYGGIVDIEFLVQYLDIEARGRPSGCHRVDRQCPAPGRIEL